VQRAPAFGNKADIATSEVRFFKLFKMKSVTNCCSSISFSKSPHLNQDFFVPAIAIVENFLFSALSNRSGVASINLFLDETNNNKSIRIALNQFFKD
jgi:hypothetical protein